MNGGVCPDKYHKANKPEKFTPKGRKTAAKSVTALRCCCDTCR